MAPSKQALFMVAQKTGIEVFAQRLINLGWSIIGTKGTADYLKKLDIPCLDIATIIGPPIMKHKVASFSKEIFSALVCDETPEDQLDLKNLGMNVIDLVFITFYDFENAVENAQSHDEVISKWDIGGPAMMEAAIKGNKFVASNAADMEILLNSFDKGEMENDSNQFTGVKFTLQVRAMLATAKYKDSIASYLVSKVMQPN